MEQLVNVDLLKHSQHGHGVHGRDDRAEQQARQEVHGRQSMALELANAVQQTTNEEGIPERSHHCKHENSAHVLSELPYGQEVAGVEDDGRQQEQEEDIGLQWRRDLAYHFHETADQQAHHDQQTALRHDGGQARDQVEPWKRMRNMDASRQDNCNHWSII